MSSSIFNVDIQAQMPAVGAPFIPRDGNTLLLDVKGASAFLGLSSWQVRGLVASGDLRVVRVGRKFYFRKSALMRWAERAEE
jgi:excisionase family DNA binding protein